MNVGRHLFIVLYTLCCLSVASCKGQQDNDKVKAITPRETQVLLKSDNVQLIDVRTPEEYNTGYIANAQNIDYFSPTFDEDIKKLDKEKPVIVYCKSGRRSTKSSEILLNAGFVNIYNLKGGITQWKLEGLKINR